MPAPRYLVTCLPGLLVPEVGFVRPGGIFDAPAGFRPSTTFLPLNPEASAELAKVFALEEAALEKRLERLQRVSGVADLTAVDEQLERLRVAAARAQRVLSDEEIGAFRAQYGFGDSFRRAIEQDPRNL